MTNENTTQTKPARHAGPIARVCRKCGNHDITHDALVGWNETDQEWEITCVLDNSDCSECGASGNWIDDEVSIGRKLEKARADAADSANRQMRKAGRKKWNEDDYQLAVKELERIYPLETRK